MFLLLLLCGRWALDSLPSDIVSLSQPEFITTLVTTVDPLLPDAIARRGATAWATVRAVTLIACYRQKELFEGLSTRKEAVAATGHTSWSSWLQSVGLPMSAGLVRQRCMEIHGYIQQGADWMSILNILAYCPTAGADVLTNIVDPGGEIETHIDVNQLPGGSVQGLLEAIAALPDPGQARKLVSEVSGAVQVYATDAVYMGGKLYFNTVYERPGANDLLYLTVSCHKEGGDIIELPENVARWIVSRVGGNINA